MLMKYSIKIKTAAVGICYTAVRAAAAGRDHVDKKLDLALRRADRWR